MRPEEILFAEVDIGDGKANKKYGEDDGQNEDVFLEPALGAENVCNFIAAEDAGQSAAPVLQQNKSDERAGRDQLDDGDDGGGHNV